MSMGGATPLPWSEISAWAAMTQTPVSVWEAGVLHKLSAAYSNARNAGSEKGAQSPWAEFNGKQSMQNLMKMWGSNA